MKGGDDGKVSVVPRRARFSNVLPIDRALVKGSLISRVRTLRAMESFSVVKRLERTVRSLWTLDFSSSSSVICWLISSRFSRRSSMPAFAVVGTRGKKRVSESS